MAMEMTLRQKQSTFVWALGELIIYAHEKGYELTLGEGHVDVRRQERLHMPGTLHRLRLAQDLNLFVNGRWIADGDHPVWEELGKFWESLHPLARWGGRFGDANHFSFEHGGKA